MITFLDGPAAGQTLQLRRTPILLRVVRSPRGKWDALDQLDDVPKPDETITVYRRRDDLPITKYHLYGGKLTGWYINASYSVVPGQPRDSDVRTTAAWQTWASQRSEPGPGWPPPATPTQSELFA